MIPTVSGGVLAALLLGVLQGLTEFLPVSSSGHLVLFQQFVDIGEDEVLFDLVLHLGTLVPVIWFYREAIGELIRDPLVGKGPWLERPGVQLWKLLIAATIPTGVIGLLFEDLFEQLFATPAVLTLTFAITGVLLYSTRGRNQGTIGRNELPIKWAVALGVAQGLAITPGISRSGTTIAVALLLGLDREFAARFSFLMSVPAILGAVLLKLRDVEGAGLDPVQLAVGGAAALVTGYLALVLLVGLVKRGQLSWFAWYCWFAAACAGLLAAWQAGWLG